MTKSKDGRPVFEDGFKQGRTDVAGHVFISYSHEDAADAQILYESIVDEGIPAWLDSQLRYGDKIAPEIKKAIQECSAFVLILSSNAKKSGWVSAEFRLATAYNKEIFPILLEGKPWRLVKGYKWIDARGNKQLPEEFYETLQHRRSVWRKQREEYDQLYRQMAADGKTVYQCDACGYPLQYESPSGFAIALLAGLPFIAGGVARHLTGWLIAVGVFLALFGGVLALVSSSERLFKDPPAICPNPECGKSLQKPLRKYDSGGVTFPAGANLEDPPGGDPPDRPPMG